MKHTKITLALLAMLMAGPAFADEAEIKAAQSTIDSQIKAFLANDNATAYDFAAPNIKHIFPTLDVFMHMVQGAYKPVWHPQSYAFGKSRQTGPTSVIQQVLIVGEDGKNYEAVYTLQQQSDGTFLITGVSLKASNSLST